MFDRFPVAYFSDQYDIGCQAQGMLEGVLVTPGIHAYLPLVDIGPLVRGHELDWVLYVMIGPALLVLR